MKDEEIEKCSKSDMSNVDLGSIVAILAGMFHDIVCYILRL